jgi:ATPase subunit of ABC transporter with duplicated ATPase domains
MIQLTGAAKRFGPKTLFENLDWLVTPTERAGIVGSNGTGKSTLPKIPAGTSLSRRTVFADLLAEAPLHELAQGVAN